jgi:hypothetical protein
MLYTTGHLPFADGFLPPPPFPRPPPSLFILRFWALRNQGSKKNAIKQNRGFFFAAAKGSRSSYLYRHLRPSSHGPPPPELPPPPPPLSPIPHGAPALTPGPDEARSTSHLKPETRSTKHEARNSKSREHRTENKDEDAHVPCVVCASVCAICVLCPVCCLMPNYLHHPGPPPRGGLCLHCCCGNGSEMPPQQPSDWHLLHGNLSQLVIASS